MHLRLSQALRLVAVALTLHTAPFTLRTSAQRPPAQPHAAEILHKMQKLNVLGSVLYIVAHPDDENTRLIAWLANGKKVRTGNLSLTRGDGGQNLIGPELGDALGIIRTQELMEARRIDGGEQFFTRAVDFGYSKNAAESFEKWGKQEVLSDVVRVIRTFRPDVIITRFAPDRSAGHGHHEASAILAEEAFDLAGDPKAFPEQLKEGLEVWQPRRLFFNGSTWWKKDLAEIAKSDPDWFSVDVGGYDPLLGLSYTEIAGRSRSMHKSQGFGAAETRGEMLEYLKLVKGDRPKTKDIFEGIDMTWGREKGEEISEALSSAIKEFNVTVPGKNLVNLNRLYRLFRKPMGHYWYLHREALEQLLRDCPAIVVEATASTRMLSNSDSITLAISCVTRTDYPQLQLRWFTDLDRNEGSPLNSGIVPNTLLSPNVATTWQFLWNRPVEPEAPHWLKNPHTALYAIDNPRDRISPTVRSKPRLKYWLAGPDSLKIIGDVEVLYKWVDRVAGERIRPVYVTPVASVIPKSDVLIARGGPQTVTVEVEALTDSLTGQLNVMLPEGWATTKDLKLVNIAKRNERQSFT
ncbi:MAG: PIG-L family deacetylase, partial [Flavobacteriales bacterium]|nr:PIG-L family deacetylase [Flavobacteriales bacterium]